MASIVADNDMPTTTTEGSELPHFEDLRGILQICNGTDTNPGVVSYLENDIQSVINMFAKTCKTFLNNEAHNPLRYSFYRIVLSKKYSVDFGGARVDLEQKNITNEDLRKIGELLKTNKTLKKLSLSDNSTEWGGNNITDYTDVQCICEGLKRNNTLKKLDLSKNNITDVQSIVELIKTNNTLTELDLPYTYYCHNINYAQSIGEALKANNTLETLWLYNNNITDVQSIGEGL